MKKRIPCLVLTALGAASILMLLRAVIASALLPGKLVIIAGCAFTVLLLAGALLLWNPQKKVRFFFGVLATLLLIAMMTIGAFALNRAVEAVNRLTSASGNYSHVGVYVRKDDPAQNLEDARDYTFGILSVQDRENTNSAMLQIIDVLENEPTVQEYEGLAMLARAFSDGECGAVVLNEEYLLLISELEGMDDITQWTRELVVMKVEVPTEPTTQPTTKPTEATTEPTETTEPEVFVPEVFSVYFSGNDQSGTLYERGRSDVNIIGIVNTGTRQILLITTPRDYYVALPFDDYPMDKLTHACIYGINRPMMILGGLYDIDIDYYFRVNFSGFKAIVDALGGITVYSDYDFKPLTGPFYFTKGENFVNGEEALAFARERYAFAAGDNQRGKNQLAVIRGIVKKACSPAILTSYLDILDSLEGSFFTDIPYEKIAMLVRMQLADPQEWEIISVNATGYDAFDHCYSLGCSAYVMKQDYSSTGAIRDLVQKMLNGEVIEQP